MHLRIMQSIDHYLGPACCLLLGLARRLRPRQPAPHSIRRILLIKFWGIGSITLMTPAIDELRRMYPDSRIDFLTNCAQVPIARRIRRVEHVYGLDLSGLWRFLCSGGQAIGAIRRRRYDLVFDFEFFTNFSALVCWLTGSFCVGFEYIRTWRNRIYDRTAVYDHSLHIGQIFAKLANVLNGHHPPRALRLEPFRVPDADRRGIRALLADAGIAPDDYLVVVNPNAGDLSQARRWPAASFTILLDRLTAIDGFRVALIGAAGEAGYVAALHDGLARPGRVTNLAGHLDIDGLLALLDQADLFIGNDSGPLHLAVAQQVPTVSFFGPETPHLYGPIGEGHKVYYTHRTCSPCLNIYAAKRHRCQDNRCMQEIDPAVVADWVVSYVNRNRNRKSLHLVEGRLSRTALG